mmetsp:Transcript_20498/g.27130  ORF Transcript_20498/g.27130 Transcript_20498/m.27130 type:complete len:91 (+) Transcript_20498:386-658(+)
MFSGGGGGYGGSVGGMASSGGGGGSVSGMMGSGSVGGGFSSSAMTTERLRGVPASSYAASETVRSDIVVVAVVDLRFLFRSSSLLLLLGG